MFSGVKYLIFLNRFPLNRDFVHKQEFEAFYRDGLRVRYLDLSFLFRKASRGHEVPEDLRKWLVPMANKQDVFTYLKRHAKDALVVSFVQYMPNSAWLYNALFKSGAPYVVAQNPSQPRLRKKGFDAQLLSERVAKLYQRFNWQKTYEKPLQLIQFALSKQMLRPARMALSYQREPNKSMAPLVGADTRFVFTSAVDYKTALDVNKEPLIEGEYALFVDQFFCHHTDFKTHHIVHHFTAEEYYPLLNRYLKAFSKVNKLPVVVAGHPRRIGAFQDDFDFPIIVNKTAELVHNANVVLVHFSTAISYSVIFNKPLVFLDAAIFNNSTVRLELDRFTDFFNCSRAMIDQVPKEKEAWVNPQSPSYSKYLNAFLKPADTEDVTLRACLMGL